MKKKKSKKVCVGIVIAIAIILMISKINHEIRLKQETKVLQQYDVGEQIDINRKKINIYTAGNSSADNTIVYMHGLGMGDTTITARPMLEQLEDNFKISIIDRYGNGMSDDTNDKQTVRKIIEEYRNALKNINQEAPYILIAHSISGIYATYWAQNYPNEIKAIIYLDADPVECFVEEGKVDLLTLFLSKVEYLASSLGLQRLFVSDSMLIGKVENQIFEDEQNTMRKYLLYQHTYSKATCSEMELYYENAKTVLDGDMNFNIPQLYIVANDVEGEYYEEVYKELLENQFNGDKEKIGNKVDRRKRIINDKISYMNRRSNIDVVELSGPHCIYEYNPSKVSSVINEYLDNIVNCKMD